MDRSQRMWDDGSIKRNLKPVSKQRYREMGIDPSEGFVKVETLEKLRENPPNIIIAEATKTFRFVQNWFKEQELKKKNKYVMGFGVYQQLHTGANSKTKLLKPAVVKFKNVYRPYIGQDLHDKTVLVFRTGGIGDLLFIQPNLRYLKQKYATCKVLFACGPQYQSMVETWTDCIDEVLDLPFNAIHLMKSDYHILFEGVIERCKQAEKENAYNLFSKWMGLNLPDELLIPRQEPKKDLVEKCSNILSDLKVKQNDFILMQLRASSPIRTPRHQFWVNIINELNDRGYIILLTDNPKQKDNVDKFISLLKKQDMCFNFCQYSESLDYSIALTKLSKCTLTTDSAFAHIAASLDIPCFGIYGPFPGFVRLKTYKKARWIDAKRHCSPCFLHGHKPCGQASSDGYSPCYDELDIKDTVDKFEEFLNDKNIFNS